MGRSHGNFELRTAEHERSCRNLMNWASNSYLKRSKIRQTLDEVYGENKFNFIRIDNFNKTLYTTLLKRTKKYKITYRSPIGILTVHIFLKICDYEFFIHMKILKELKRKKHGALTIDN